MAEKEKKPKKHLYKIIHTFAHDGSAAHEHVYKNKKEDPDSEAHPPQFAGTSQNIEDLMQHDQDHAGPQMEAGGGEQDAETPADNGEAEPGAAGAGAPPAGQ